MRAYLLTTTLLFFCANCIADDVSENLQQFLPQQCQLMGQFIQTQQKAQITKPLVSYGRFVFDCKKGLIWETQQPIKETTVHLKNNGSYQVIDGKAQALKGMAFKKVGELLNQLLSGEVAAIDRDFRVSLNGEKATLTPRRGKIKKFMNNVQINKKQNGANIQLNYSDQEYSELSLELTEKPERINQDSCSQTQIVDPIACKKLFPPPTPNPQ